MRAGGGPWPDGTRVFIGNLASEATTKRELREIFEAYGVVEEVILHESYGFIQYKDSADAQTAIQKETGRLIGGRKIDVQLSNKDRRRSQREEVDDRRPSRSGPPGRGRSRSPPGARYRDNRDSRDFEPGRRESAAFDRRPPSPDRRFSRDTYDRPGADRRGEDFDRFRRDAGRDRFDERQRSPYGSRDFLPPRRDRSRSPPRPGYPRRSPDRRPGEFDRRDPRDVRDARDPRDFRDPRDPREGRDSRYASPPRREEDMRRPVPKNPDCYVLVLAQEQRHYANYVMNRIRDVGLETDMMMVLDRSLPAEIHALVMRGIPFACVIGPKDEMARTSSVSLLKRNPPEDLHGIPIEEALRVLAREFELWRQAQAELARAGIASVPPIGALAMTLPQSPARPQYGAPVPPAGVRPELTEEDALLAKQAEIQANILNILQQAGGGGGGGSAPMNTVSSDAMQSMQHNQQMQAMRQSIPNATMGMPNMMPNANGMRQMSAGQFQSMPPNMMMPGVHAPQGNNQFMPAGMASMQQRGARPPFVSPYGMGMPQMPSGGGGQVQAEPDKINKAFSDLLLLKQKGFFDKGMK